MKCVFGQVKTAPNWSERASENDSVICSIPEEQNDYYIELFSVGSRSEFYLNIASYRVFYAILFYFVDYGIPLSNKDRVIYISISRMPN